jgi:hypothetical protein
MRLYRSKIAAIASDCIQRLINDGDIDVAGDKRGDAELDLVAIMEDYLRRDGALREATRDYNAANSISFERAGRTRTQLAEADGHPLHDDVERYLARQFTESLMISPAVEEVYADDKVIWKKIFNIVKSHDVDEEAIREEARGKLKNMREGTVEFEIAMENAIRDVKKRRGLIAPPER